MKTFFKFIFTYPSSIIHKFFGWFRKSLIFQCFSFFVKFFKSIFCHFWFD